MENKVKNITIEGRLLNCKRNWEKPGLVKLSIKSTYNDPATCAQSNKFTGTSETFGPLGAEITCGPTLS